MKKIYMIVLILLLWLNGCDFEDPVYTFQNQEEEITSIELIHNHNEYGEGINELNFHFIRTLDEEESLSFIPCH